MTTPIQTTPLLAWHFTRADGTTQYLKKPEPLGVKQVFKGEVIPCQSGFHASVRAVDALKYAPGFHCRRVECGGQIVPHNDDKVTCSERTPIAEADAQKVVAQWAFWCANRAVKVHAVAALNRAGLTEEANKLAALVDITDQESADAACAAADAAYAAAYAADAARAAYAAAYAACAAADAACAAAYAADAACAAAYAAYAEEYDFCNAELERRLLALLETVNQ